MPAPAHEQTQDPPRILAGDGRREADAESDAGADHTATRRAVVRMKKAREWSARRKKMRGPSSIAPRRCTMSALSNRCNELSNSDSLRLPAICGNTKKRIAPSTTRAAQEEAVAHRQRIAGGKLDGDPLCDRNRASLEFARTSLSPSAISSLPSGGCSCMKKMPFRYFWASAT